MPCWNVEAILVFEKSETIGWDCLLYLKNVPLMGNVFYGKNLQSKLNRVIASIFEFSVLSAREEIIIQEKWD